MGVSAFRKKSLIKDDMYREENGIFLCMILSYPKLQKMSETCLTLI